MGGGDCRGKYCDSRKVDVIEQLGEEEQEMSQSDEIETPDEEADEVEVESSEEDNLFSRG